MANNCFFRLQKLDMFELEKTNKNRTKFTEKAMELHDEFMDDAARQEENTGREAFIVRQQDKDDFYNLDFAKDLAELQKFEMEDNERQEQAKIKHSYQGLTSVSQALNKAPITISNIFGNIEADTENRKNTKTVFREYAMHCEYLAVSEGAISADSDPDHVITENETTKRVVKKPKKRELMGYVVGVNTVFKLS